MRSEGSARNASSAPISAPLAPPRRHDCSSTPERRLARCLEALRHVVVAPRRVQALEALRSPRRRTRAPASIASADVVGQRQCQQRVEIASHDGQVRSAIDFHAAIVRRQVTACRSRCRRGPPRAPGRRCTWSRRSGSARRPTPDRDISSASIASSARARSTTLSTTDWPSPAIPVAGLTRTAPMFEQPRPACKASSLANTLMPSQHDVGDAAGKLRDSIRGRTRRRVEQRMRDRLGGDERVGHDAAEEIAFAPNAGARGRFALQRVARNEVGRRGVVDAAGRIRPRRRSP